MTRRWIIAYTALLVSGGLAAFAFFYHPAQEVTLLMRHALRASPVWSIRVQGHLGATPLEADIVADSGGRQLARVSYAPLKLINNQWILVDGHSASSSASPRSVDLLSSIRLTDTLASVKEEGRYFVRYRFVLSPEISALLPDLADAEGELWFPRRLGYWFPVRAVLAFKMNSGAEVALDLRVSPEDAFALRYTNPDNPRPLSEVIEQIARAQTKDGVLPESPPALRTSHGHTAAFYSDFDQDGLHDAVEIFYGTDAENSDSDNDTFLDGQEVERGYSPTGTGVLN